MSLLTRLSTAVAACALLLPVACDVRHLQELVPQQSTEADVRARFGEPQRVWEEADGSRTLEYNRQPEGRVNYMVVVDAQGVMTALRQVLVPENFARVQPGMEPEAVRRLLGQPALRTPYALKQETEWDWRWMEDGTRPMVFSVTFGADGRVLRSGSRLEVPISG